MKEKFKMLSCHAVGPRYVEKECYGISERKICLTGFCLLINIAL